MVPELQKAISIYVWMRINFAIAEIFLLSSGCELKNLK